VFITYFLPSNRVEDPVKIVFINKHTPIDSVFIYNFYPAATVLWCIMDPVRDKNKSNNGYISP